MSAEQLVVVSAKANNIDDEDVVPLNWDDEKGDLTIARAYHQWSNETLIARRAKEDPAVAYGNNTSIIKLLYKYLRGLDFDVEVLECSGPKFPLVDVPTRLAERIKDEGALNVAKHLTHAVIKVNHLILDPCFRRLGGRYFHKDNYMLVEIDEKWKMHMKVSHLVDLKPDDIKAAVAAVKKEMNTADSFYSRSASTRVLKRNRRARHAHKVLSIEV